MAHTLTLCRLYTPALLKLAKTLTVRTELAAIARCLWHVPPDHTTLVSGPVCLEPLEREEGKGGGRGEGKTRERRGKVGEGMREEGGGEECPSTCT